MNAIKHSIRLLFALTIIYAFVCCSSSTISCRRTLVKGLDFDGETKLVFLNEKVGFLSCLEKNGYTALYQSCNYGHSWTRISESEYKVTQLIADSGRLYVVYMKPDTGVQEVVFSDFYRKRKKLGDFQKLDIQVDYPFRLRLQENIMLYLCETTDGRLVLRKYNYEENTWADIDLPSYVSPKYAKICSRFTNESVYVSIPLETGKYGIYKYDYHHNIGKITGYRSGCPQFLANGPYVLSEDRRLSIRGLNGDVVMSRYSFDENTRYEPIFLLGSRFDMLFGAVSTSGGTPGEYIFYSSTGWTSVRKINCKKHLENYRLYEDQPSAYMVKTSSGFKAYLAVSIHGKSYMESYSIKIPPRSRISQYMMLLEYADMQAPGIKNAVTEIVNIFKDARAKYDKSYKQK